MGPARVDWGEQWGEYMKKQKATRTPKRTHRVTYGQGSFQWVEAKQTWRGRIDAGYTPDGKRRRIEVTDRDEDKAWAKFIAKKKDLEEGTLTSNEIDRTTVKQWAAEWLNIREGEVRAKTFSTDKSIVNKWITPGALGRKQLRDLRPADVRALAAAIEKAGRSATTARYAQRIFVQLLSAAKHEGYKVPDNVLTTKKSAVAVSDRDAIPLEGCVNLLRIAAGMKDGGRWAAALLQGMRQGECLGLRWDSVDFEQNTIEVAWQLQALPYADRDRGTFVKPTDLDSVHLMGAYHLVPPKSRKGFRVIPMTPWMREILTDWKKIAPASPHGLVWPRANGEPRNPKDDADAWKALQATAEVWKAPGRHYVLHEARNSTASLLLELGVDPEVIKEILGHSDIVTTRGYQRVSTQLKLAALESLSVKIKTAIEA